MTPDDVFARALAAALLDGEWERRTMLARVRDALGANRPIPRVLFLLPAMFVILGGSPFLHLIRTFQ